jgi:hypothetical protein
MNITIKEGLFMNAFKYVAGFFFAICLIIGIGINVEASEFLGDFCWSVDDGSGDGPTSKVGVFHMGGGHYQLLGTSKHSSDGTYILHGNAEVIENKINASIIMADGNNNAMSTLHTLAVLDPSTLNGTYNMLHTGAAGWTDQTEIRFSTGTMTSIPCSN